MIAFDVSQANDTRRTGIGRAVNEFIKSILWLHEQGEWDLGKLVLLSCWPFRQDEETLRLLRQFEVETRVLPSRSMYIYRATRLPLWCLRNRPDLLFVPEPIYPTPKLGCRRLAVMHYDLITRHAAAVASRHIRLLYRLFMLPTLRRADRVGVDSEFVRQETAKLLPGFLEKSEVLPIYVHEEPKIAPQTPEGIDEQQPFALFVGNLLPHKNVRRLVAAFEKWQDSAPDEFIPLYIVGRARPEVDDISPLLESLAARGIVRQFGYVDDAHLEWLYSNARFFAFPSLVEGFGLPILEAMSRGCPVLTANGGATEEAAGGAAMLVDAMDVEEMVNGLARIAHEDSLREQLTQNGFQRLKNFTRESHSLTFRNFLNSSMDKDLDETERSRGRV